MSIPSLNVDPTPRLGYNQLSVRCTLPNTSPDLMEDGITSRLESSLAQIPNLKRISSISGYGESVVDLTFSESTYVSSRLFEIQSILRRVYPQLPAGSSFPQIIANEGDEEPLLSYAVTGGDDKAFKDGTVRNDLNKLCSGIEGVSKVDIAGGRRQQLMISLDELRCLPYMLSADSIGAIIRGALQGRMAGEIETDGGHSYCLWMRGISGVSNVENILIGAKFGRLVHLKDVATVTLANTDDDTYYRVNGKNALLLSVYPHHGVNTIILAGTVKKAMDGYAARKGASYSILLQNDESAPLSAELGLNYRRLAIAIAVFSGFLLLFSGGTRNAIVLLLSLIANFCITLLLTSVLHIPLQSGSIIGFCVSFGLTSDNTLVIMDHYGRTGNRKIIGALFMSTLTTLSGLLFFYWLFRDQRRDIAAFCTIISLALVASSLVCYWFVPSIYHLLHGRRRYSFAKVGGKVTRRMLRARALYYHWLDMLAGKRKWLLVGMSIAFGVPFHLMPSAWPNHSWYNSIFGSDFYQEEVRPVANILLGGALDFFISHCNNRSDIPIYGDTVLTVNCATAPNARKGSIEAVLHQLERELDTLTIIQRFALTIHNREEGEIAIQIRRKYLNTIMPYDLKNRLITRSLYMSGINWTISGFGNTYTTAVADPLPHFRIAMSGYNYATLKRYERMLADTLRNYSRISNITIDYDRSNQYGNNTNYQLSVDAATASYYRLDQRRLWDETAFLSGRQSIIGDVEVEGQLYPISIGNIRSDSITKYLLMHERLRAGPKRYIALSSVSMVEPLSMSAAIRKEGRQYVCMLQLDYTGNSSFGTKLIDHKLNDLKNKMPIGFSATLLADEDGSWGESPIKYDLLIMYLVIFYILCSILFESLVQPLCVLCMIPVAYIGIFLSPALTGGHFGDGGFAAFLLVGSLAVSTSIFVINDLNAATPGNRNKAIAAVLTRRSRVILFTTFSACCSFIPFLLEGNSGSFWFTFAVSTIAGLLALQFGIFIILPVLCWNRQRS